ncbi:hypothetical protein ACJMK2_005382 [Sinanodonta woodiana]|uniref:SWIM-type domain-containing protein n=1 Tax=Sinanodonta woodiana TaxID=1069815 RepID=A0ABD3VT06_SINWO
MATPDKLKALFEDLGKPTLRGVRKCPKCGTYNGTRGISCKNKACDVIFKEKEKKKGHSADAVKIITGSTVQVFSVRLRDRGPDYRGFVQLPLVQDLDGNPAQVVDPAVLCHAARCYVESCSRSSQIGLSDQVCPHIKSAIECSQEAQPLTLKNSILNSLQVSNETKQAIWLLATESTGPLVQRVTKNIMVVKCKPNPKQQLGFLHLAFFETARNRSQPEHKFQCSCKSFRAAKNASTKEDLFKRCVHFYACICAFASDEKLAEEFSFYINLDMNVTSPPSPETQLVTIYQPADDTGEVSDTPTLEVVVTEDMLEPAIKRKRKDEIVQASNALLTLQDANLNVISKRIPSPTKSQLPKQLQPPKKIANTPVDETEVATSFHQWLTSVTERINQTMHYQFDGNPDPLVFHAPQCFFECLQQRISSGNRKKRLPNFTTAFVRKDALPLGTFTKYTWHITNIIHVKQIFDTPELSLDITRNFVENRDGTYDLYEIPKVRVENVDDQYKGKNPVLIRPFELKTYLRVGNTSSDQKEPTPFIIEWIPDILPKSHIGELRIKFEYGHQRNGHIEHRIPTSEVPIHVQELST